MLFILAGFISFMLGFNLYDLLSHEYLRSLQHMRPCTLCIFFVIKMVKMALISVKWKNLERLNLDTKV